MPNEIAPNVLSWASELDELTTEQAARTARLPILAGHLALMPDAHFGMGATIGSVIATETAVIPSAVVAGGNLSSIVIHVMIVEPPAIGSAVACVP